MEFREGVRWQGSWAWKGRSVPTAVDVHGQASWFLSKG